MSSLTWMMELPSLSWSFSSWASSWKHFSGFFESQLFSVPLRLTQLAPYWAIRRGSLKIWPLNYSGSVAVQVWRQERCQWRSSSVDCDEVGAAAVAGEHASLAFNAAALFKMFQSRCYRLFQKSELCNRICCSKVSEQVKWKASHYNWTSERLVLVFSAGAS